MPRLIQSFLASYPISSHASFYLKVFEANWILTSWKRKSFEILFNEGIDIFSHSVDLYEILKMACKLGSKNVFLKLCTSTILFDKLNDHTMIFPLLKIVIDSAVRHVCLSKHGMEFKVSRLNDFTDIFEQLVGHLDEEKANYIFTAEGISEIFSSLESLGANEISISETLINVDDILRMSIHAEWASFAKFLITKRNAQLPTFDAVTFENSFWGQPMQSLVQFFASDKEIYETFDQETKLVIDAKINVQYYNWRSIKNTLRLMKFQTTQELAQELFGLAEKIGVSFIELVNIFELYMSGNLKEPVVSSHSGKSIDFSLIYPGLTEKLSKHLSTMTSIIVDFISSGRLNDEFPTLSELLSTPILCQTDIQKEELMKSLIPLFDFLGNRDIMI